MIEEDAKRYVNEFASICNIAAPEWSLKTQGNEMFLAIYVGAVNDIYMRALERIKEEINSDHPLNDSIYLSKKKPENWLLSSETQLLQTIFSESLTVGKATLRSEFHRKFIPFLGGEERRIYSEANHVVFGRRGAGKSSLVLYACHQAMKESKPYAWIALQQYVGREDLLVIPHVLHDLVEGLSQIQSVDQRRIDRLRNVCNEMESFGEALTKADIAKKIAVFSRDLVPIAEQQGPLYIFLDDLHLIHPSLQPFLLSTIYSFSRGNSIYLKITSIEHLTQLSDADEKEGLQTPGDAQVIRLDYNLVDPGRALSHTKKIIESYIQYVGLPGLSSILPSQALERLVWVSAGVPRDALYICNNAITKASSANRRKIAVMDVNMAAADSLTEKQKYVSDDVGDKPGSVLNVVEDIKEFCLKEIRCNAFLVRLSTQDSKYQTIRKISDLRFIHIIHQGITPGEAGEKYEAYMLDYAFYTGFRKAPSVKEFISRPKQALAKEIRKLERYPYEARKVF